MRILKTFIVVIILLSSLSAFADDARSWLKTEINKISLNFIRFMILGLNNVRVSNIGLIFLKNRKRLHGCEGAFN